MKPLRHVKISFTVVVLETTINLKQKKIVKEDVWLRRLKVCLQIIMFSDDLLRNWKEGFINNSNETVQSRLSNNHRHTLTKLC